MPRYLREQRSLWEWVISAILSEKSKKIYTKSPLITAKQVTAKEPDKEYGVI